MGLLAGEEAGDVHGTEAHHAGYKAVADVGHHADVRLRLHKRVHGADARQWGREAAAVLGVRNGNVPGSDQQGGGVSRGGGSNG